MKRKKDIRAKILITGGAGYIGSALIGDALACGYGVRCLDLLVYGKKFLARFSNHPHFEFIRGDIRDERALKKSLKNIDYVVHLAAIVGDLPCRAAPKSAVEINFKGTKLLAEAAKQFGIKRFVFASTCSNYGIVDSQKGANENRELNPISLYAETKIDSEQFLKSLSDKHFSVTSLRFATGYGISPRTRFDLLINSFAYEAWAKNEIVIFAADTWRPYIHVSDMCLIIRKVLEAPLEKVGGEIFNAGCNSQNYMKRDVIEILKKNMPQLRAKYIDSVDDRRNYKVNFDKLEQTINFRPSRSIEYGFKELMHHFKHGLLTEDDFKTNKLEALEKFFEEKEKVLKNKI